jgi:hypothetical protein
MVHDPERTLLLPVTLPEELPVSETIELVERARDDIGIALDRVVVNRWPSAPPDGLAGALAGLPDRLDFEVLPEPPQLRALADHAATRAAIARTERTRVASGCGLPIVEMPVLAEGFGPDLAWTERVGCVLEEPYRPETAATGADAA